MLKKLVFIIITILVVNSGSVGILFAQNLGWQEQKTAYFMVYYQPDVNLNTVFRRLNKRFFNTKSGLELPPSSSPGDRMAYRLDLLFSKTQQVLDMYPRVDGVAIKIFKTRKDLNAEYFNIFQRSENYKSFYIHKHGTIYTSEQDISDSIISHEMAHAIVDSYFNYIPPGRIAELIAQYADVHLEE